MKIYTALEVNRWGNARILYCGKDKELAESTRHEFENDEPAPDKHDCFHWIVREDEFPDWD